MTTPRQFGMTLRRIRKARGMSQYAVAKAARISREYVRKLEAGQYDPTIGTVQRLAKALKVTVMELLK